MTHGEPPPLPPVPLAYARPRPRRPALGALAALFFAGIAGVNGALFLAALVLDDDWTRSPIFGLGVCGIGLTLFAVTLFVFGTERRLSGIRGGVRGGSLARALLAGFGYALPVHFAGAAWDLSPVPQAVLTSLLPTYALLFPLLIPLWVVRSAVPPG